MKPKIIGLKANLNTNSAFFFREAHLRENVRNNNMTFANSRTNFRKASLNNTKVQAFPARTFTLHRFPYNTKEIIWICVKCNHMNIYQFIYLDLFWCSKFYLYSTKETLVYQPLKSSRVDCTRSPQHRDWLTRHLSLESGGGVRIDPSSRLSLEVESPAKGVRSPVGGKLPRVTI